MEPSINHDNLEKCLRDGPVLAHVMPRLPGATKASILTLGAGAVAQLVDGRNNKLGKSAFVGVVSLVSW